MSELGTARWESLEQWSSELFLIAAGLLLVHAAIHVIIAFTSMTYPFHHEVPFGFVGMMLGLVALLGLYPQLATRNPKLARAGAGLAVLGTVGWFVIGVSSLSEDLGMTPPEWLVAFVPLLILGVVFGYLAFSVAGLRTEVLSRTTVVAVSTPALVMVFNIALGITLPDLSEGAVIVASGFALAHLAIGLALRLEDFPAGPAEPAAGIAS